MSVEDAKIIIIDTVVEYENGRMFKVICPTCGETHAHSGGESSIAFTECLGFRWSHCHRGPGYNLVIGDATKWINKKAVTKNMLR